MLTWRYDYLVCAYTVQRITIGSHDNTCRLHYVTQYYTGRFIYTAPSTVNVKNSRLIYNNNSNNNRLISLTQRVTLYTEKQKQEMIQLSTDYIDKNRDAALEGLHYPEKYSI